MKLRIIAYMIIVLVISYLTSVSAYYVVYLNIDHPVYQPTLVSLYISTIVLPSNSFLSWLFLRKFEMAGQHPRILKIILSILIAITIVLGIWLGCPVKP